MPPRISAPSSPIATACLANLDRAADQIGGYPGACHRRARPRFTTGGPVDRRSIQAAGDSAKSASAVTGLLLAEAPLKAVPGLERKLTAELNRTVGAHH